MTSISWRTATEPHQLSSPFPVPLKIRPRSIGAGQLSRRAGRCRWSPGTTAGVVRCRVGSLSITFPSEADAWQRGPWRVRDGRGCASSCARYTCGTARWSGCALSRGELTDLGRRHLLPGPGPRCSASWQGNAASRHRHTQGVLLPFQIASPLSIRDPGQFDPFRWLRPRAAQRHLRWTTLPPGQAFLIAARPQVITGAPGSAGWVEGVVRCLASPRGGAHFRQGEVLVAAQTDIAWTLLFPRAPPWSPTWARPSRMRPSSPASWASRPWSAAGTRPPG